MSHFSVAVFTENNGKELDELLAPFDEQLEFPRYIYATREQLIEREKKQIEDYKNTVYAEYLKDPVAYEKRTNNKSHIEYLKNGFPKKLQRTDDEIYLNAIKYEEVGNIGPNGEVYATFNRNGYWDYYSVGGRWDSCLKLKNGGKVNSGKVKDLDFSINKEIYDEAIKRWEEEEQKVIRQSEENKFHSYFINCLLNVYKTKENYATARASFGTYAVITPDGEWHAPGTVGFWGMSSASIDEERDFSLNYKKNFIDSANPEWIMTIVDCHI